MTTCFVCLVSSENCVWLPFRKEGWLKYVKTVFPLMLIYYYRIYQENLFACDPSIEKYNKTLRAFRKIDPSQVRTYRQSPSININRDISNFTRQKEWCFYALHQLMYLFRRTAQHQEYFSVMDGCALKRNTVAEGKSHKNEVYNSHDLPRMESFKRDYIAIRIINTIERRIKKK